MNKQDLSEYYLQAPSQKIYQRMSFRSSKELERYLHKAWQWPLHIPLFIEWILNKGKKEKVLRGMYLLWQFRYGTTIIKMEGVRRAYVRSSLIIFHNHIGICCIDIGILKLVDVYCEMEQISNPLVLRISSGFLGWNNGKTGLTCKRDL